jgi:hypothetical protein
MIVDEPKNGAGRGIKSDTYRNDIIILFIEHY